MKGAKFAAWLRNRLLPTFAVLHPGKKMILVMDSAAYHKARDESWVSGSKSQSKHELAHLLLDLGVSQLTTTNAYPRTVPAHRFEASIGEGGLLQGRSAGRCAEVAGGASGPQPHRGEAAAERRWSCGRLHSSLLSGGAADGRSLTEARQQTEDGFEAVTEMFCNSIVKHCHDWIDHFLQTDAAEGLLQCGTLAGVIKHQRKGAPARDIFESGQLYVAVSRVRQLKGYVTPLFIHIPLNAFVVITSKASKREPGEESTRRCICARL
jgi:hypothetical protein